MVKMSSITVSYFGVLCFLMSAFSTYFVTTAEEICYAFQEAELGGFFGQFRCTEFCCGSPEMDRKYCCRQCHNSVYRHDCPKEITGGVVGGTLTFLIIIAVLFVSVIACNCGCCKKQNNGENGGTSRRRSSLGTLLPSPLLHGGLLPGAACLTKPPPYTGGSPPSYSEAEAFVDQNSNPRPDFTASDLSHEHDETLFAGNRTNISQNRSRRSNSRDASSDSNEETVIHANHIVPIDDPPPPYVSTERVSGQTY